MFNFSDCTLQLSFKLLMKLQNFLRFVVKWLWSDSEGGLLRLLIYNRYESLVCFWIECLRIINLWWISSEWNVLYYWYNLLRFLICLCMVGVIQGRPLCFLNILRGILSHTMYGSVSKLCPQLFSSTSSII